MNKSTFYLFSDRHCLIQPIFSTLSSLVELALQVLTRLGLKLNTKLTFSSLFCGIFLVFALPSMGQQDSLVVEKPMEEMTWEECYAKADHFYDIWEYSKSLPYSEGCIPKAIEEFGKKSQQYALSIKLKGNNYGGLDQAQKALPLLEEALQLASQVYSETDYGYPDFLEGIAKVLSALGRHEEAIQYGKQAAEVTKNIRGANHLGYAISIENLSMFYDHADQHDEALALKEQALEIIAQQLGKDDVEYARVLYNTAHIYMTIGHHPKANAYLEEAMQIIENLYGKTHFSYGMIMEVLGMSYLSEGAYQKAALLFQELLIRNEQAYGKTHYNYAKASTYLGASLTGLGQVEQALPLLLEAVEIYKNLEHEMPLHYAATLERLIPVYQSLNQHPKAIKAALEALDIYEKYYGEDTPTMDIANMLGVLGNCYEDVDSIQQSTKYFTAANQHWLTFIQHRLDNFHTQGQQSYFSQIANKFPKMYSFMVRHPEAASVNIASLHNVLYTKGLSLKNNQQLFRTVQQSEQPELIQTYENWLALRKSIYKQYSLPATEQSSSLDSLVDKADQLERRLAMASSEFRASRSLPDWKMLQETLEADEAAIEFFHFNYISKDDEAKDSTLYLAWLIKKDLASPQYIGLFEQQQIPNLKRTAQLYAYPQKGQKNNLHHLLWQPLEKHLTGIQTIYYAPSGLLHRINFGAIPISETETVATRFQIHQLGSTYQLANTTASSTYTSPSATIYGGIDYEKDTTNWTLSNTKLSTELSSPSETTTFGARSRSFLGDDWHYLEWTAHEAADIEDLLQSIGVATQTFQGQEATETSFKKLGTDRPSPRLLHLATHGYFFPEPQEDATTGFKAAEHPLIRSGLIMAGANHVWKGGQIPEGEEDGILTAYEIAQMDLSNTELVVLSACNTGLGDIDNHEGVFGLQRAFKQAGVQHILMSLWSVDDKKTYEFMTQFYALWQKDGKAIPEAYQMAQEAMRKKYSKPPNPHGWAGFILVE